MKTPTDSQAQALPADMMQSLQAKMESLKKALLDLDPEMPNHLRESHRLLITYPESVHLLDDDEIQALLQAAQKHTQTQIVSEIAKGKGTRGKTRLSVDDL